MVPGVIIMTTYKLVVIPHPPTESGIQSTCKGVMMDTSADERYLPFGHLPKAYVQVRKYVVIMTLKSRWNRCTSVSICADSQGKRIAVLYPCFVSP